MKFIKCDLSRESGRTREMGVEMILMPRSCSATVTSVYRISLFRFHGSTRVVSINMSRSVVFPSYENP